jgi:hypothetical protein
MNYREVLLAAVSSFVLGGLWYSGCGIDDCHEQVTSASRNVRS